VSLVPKWRDQSGRDRLMMSKMPDFGYLDALYDDEIGRSCGLADAADSLVHQQLVPRNPRRKGPNSRMAEPPGIRGALDFGEVASSKETPVCIDADGRWSLLAMGQYPRGSVMLT
jgi:hypothetical protein